EVGFLALAKQIGMSAEALETGDTRDWQKALVRQVGEKRDLLQEWCAKWSHGGLSLIKIMRRRDTRHAQAKHAQLFLQAALIEIKARSNKQRQICVQHERGRLAMNAAVVAGPGRQVRALTLSTISFAVCFAAW